MSHQHTMEIRAVIDWLKRRPSPPRTAERAIILIKRLDGEIERLYKTLSAVQREQYMNGRNDAIKEFAERLKKKTKTHITMHVYDNGMYKPIAEIFIADMIDNLVKEMTEGEDGNV